MLIRNRATGHCVQVVIAALSSVLLMHVTAHAQEAIPVLTLPEAINQALAHNPGQATQRLEVQKAEQEQNAARGALWPSLDLGASVNRYGYPTSVIPIRELGKFPPLDDTIYDYGVALKLPLYAGGKLQQAEVLADLGSEISREQERLGAQALIYNTSSVYLKILHLSRLDDAYSTRIASLESQEKHIALRVKVGKAPRLDQLKINVLLAKARHDRLQIANRREETYTLLDNFMGRTRDANKPALITYAPASVSPWILADLRQEARAQRPELKITERRVETGEAQIKMARGERLPNLSLIGGYKERSGADTASFDDWNVGVQLSLPLIDGGVRRSRQEQAVLAREQARNAAEQTRLEIDKQVQDAWNAQEESALRVQVTESSVREAREALDIEKLKYAQGVGVITDLLNAETALLTAQADRLQAEFDLIIARLNILRATGQLTPERVTAQVIPVTGQAKENFTP